MKVAWFSAGVTSAVATKLALSMYEDVHIYYIDIKSQHSDNARFITECEKWYRQKINIITNSRGYTDQFEVIEDTRFINGPYGARCTLELKKNVRYELEEKLNIDSQVFGFEFSSGEINRAIRFQQQHTNVDALFPLIERNLTKEECHGLLKIAGIVEPEMYKLGYSNNNCVGCVKGGKGYWNKIRQDFPEVFRKMAKAERKINHSCLKQSLKEGGSTPLFLDELQKGEGILSPIVPDCGMFCQLEFVQFMDKNTDKVINGELNIYQAA